MYKQVLTLTIAIFIGETSAAYAVGKCPRPGQNWKDIHPTEDLDIHKLEGPWSSIYESYVKQFNHACLQNKFSPIENEAKRLQYLQGVSFKDDQVLYDDTTLLTFAHPTDSSFASVGVTDELHGEIKDVEAINTLESLNLPELTKQERH